MLVKGARENLINDMPALDQVITWYRTDDITWTNVHYRICASLDLNESTQNVM